MGRHLGLLLVVRRDLLQAVLGSELLIRAVGLAEVDALGCHTVKLLRGVEGLTISFSLTLRSDSSSEFPEWTLGNSKRWRAAY